MGTPTILTVDDYESLARQVLPGDVFDYFAGGAGDEWTLAENRRAFERWVIRPRMLTGAWPVDPSIRILGTDIAFPVLVAPWAYQRRAHADGELATARAAARTGTIMVVSTTTVDYLEEIAAASDAPKWWQLYVFTDRGATVEMLHRAQAGGFAAVCLTVDFPASGLRHADRPAGRRPRVRARSHVGRPLLDPRRRPAAVAREGHHDGRGCADRRRGRRRRDRRIEPRRPSARLGPRADRRAPRDRGGRRGSRAGPGRRRIPTRDGRLQGARARRRRRAGRASHVLGPRGCGGGRRGRRPPHPAGRAREHDGPCRHAFGRGHL